MNTYEIIKELARSKKISIAELERTLNLSNGSVSKWAKSAPNSEYISKVADYFNVSTDYLLGRTDDKYHGLSDEQKKKTVEEALRSAMGKDGKEIDEDDIPVLTRIIEAYLDKK